MEEKKGLLRPSWDEYFMLSAVAIATRASCIKFKSGAVIVKDKRIVASGYNGPAPGVPSGFELGYCRKDVANVDWSKKNTGHCLATHAEANALVQNHATDVHGATMYCLHFPCNECAKLIASAGIKEVIFLKHYKEEVPRTEEIFNCSGVKYRKLAIDSEKMLKVVSDVLNSAKE
ncbi:tRNA-specific adenosine deaminase [uncultured archaeon]|nr:tRNA-specific adenosine deaminase [uncultured archaeon]